MRHAEGPHAGEDSRCEVVSVGAPRYADIVPSGHTAKRVPFVRGRRYGPLLPAPAR